MLRKVRKEGLFLTFFEKKVRPKNLAMSQLGVDLIIKLFFYLFFKKGKKELFIKKYQQLMSWQAA